MLRKIISGFIGGILGLAIFSILGLLIGAIIGGNFMTSFKFNGVQGYEATGQIGAILGAVLGVSLGVFIAISIANRDKNLKNQKS